ncbi:MAG: ATP-dependent helicase HrpB [Candidatus Methylacidiphilales bacterium]
MLPIHEIRSTLLTSFASPAARVLIHAPTGSGKSTQVPQILLDNGLAGSGQIVVLQPRRLAARILAARVAQERGEPLGQCVGYEVRFERSVSPQTRIRYVTEGVLLRELLAQPELNHCAVVLFDEFHERHLYGDLTLALIKGLQATRRPDLKIGVMSATLQSGLLLKYLEPCHEIISTGRTFPVEIDYLEKPCRGEMWEAAADTWHEAAARGLDGDTLIFMPGAYEIERTLRAIGESPHSSGWDLHALHAEMPPERQDAALRRGERPRVIVSTNVAETSLTIDGVRLVIDSGCARMARFDPHRGFDALTIEKISRASAEQRSGRAGRTAPGRCIRLWTAAEHTARPAEDIPEVKRVDLAEVLLALHGLGVNVSNFDWLEAPLETSLERAASLLHDLGALHQEKLTPLGSRMLNFPLHPRFARMMIEAGQLQCVRPAAVIAALCQTKPILLRSHERSVEESRDELLGEGKSDFFREMRALEYARRHQFQLSPCRKLGLHANAARQAVQLSERFIHLAEKSGLPVDNAPPGEEVVRRCILTAFADQVARRRDGGTLRCDLVHRRRGEIERGSVVRDSMLLVASEITEVEKSSGEIEVRMRRITAIEPSWLHDLFPGDFQQQTIVSFDETTRRVTSVRATLFRDLVLENGTPGQPEPAEAARILAQQVLSGKCPLKNWNDEVEQWIIRLNSVSDWLPDSGLSSIGHEERCNLIEDICLGSFSYKEIKDKPVLPAVRGWLSDAHQLLVEQMAPERIKMPDNKRLKLRYQQGQPPVLSAKIQSLYDLKQHPTVANGRIPVVIEILGPNMRPLQITRDLPHFWKETYPELKPALSRRYPKHEWR